MSPLAVAVQEHITHIRGLTKKEPMSEDEVTQKLSALESSLQLVIHHFRTLHNIRVDLSSSTPMTKDQPDTTLLSDLYEVATTQQEWIDAIPGHVQLPTMPGFDRDWIDCVLQEVESSLGK